MEAENRGLDLEKELTCSICTEVLYQPLTLLDCLHTFCGACLKEWFAFQLQSARNSPSSSSSASSTPYTCPSCRAPVRDTKHNATVTTLLEMFVAANPEKGKSEGEREAMRSKYTPGEQVLKKVETREMTLRERRIEDEDRRLMHEVREQSLRDVGVESQGQRRERRRPESRARGQRSQSTRDESREARHREDRERRRRRELDAEGRTRTESSGVSGRSGETRSRRTDDEARRRHESSHRTAARQIEHQSSLRSLISSSDVDSHEMEEEILRQIREEGLLDGIDLENLDVNQEDQISERIAEAFRRRQSARARQEPARRSDASGRRRPNHLPAPESREASGDENVRPTTRRRRTHSRSPSAISQGGSATGDDHTRPPPSMSAAQAAHLDVHSGDEGRRRRRTMSSSRSATTPVPVAEVEARPAARSQTDLNPRPQSAYLPSSRPVIGAGSRSSTDASILRAAELPATPQRSSPSQTPRSSPRIQQTAELPAAVPVTTPKTRAAPPPDIVTPPSLPPADSSGFVDRTLLPAPLSPRQPADHTHLSLVDRATALSSGSRPGSSSSSSSKVRTELFPEPSLTCARCAKQHIEYELHYNCGICRDGQYNICLHCYRKGEGCLHWFGFGYRAFKNWEHKIEIGELPSDAEGPHMLKASRYLAPKIVPGGAEGRRTLTTEDPQKRLQSGAFCANCLAWANECYWRCDTCNEGDWGFCNICVNQGKSCTHPLLPLTYRPVSNGSALSPTHDQQIPPSARILTGPGVTGIGNFKPLTFATSCDICHYPIQPSSKRYHCFSCTSKVPDTLPGDYDICTTCYPKLVTSRRISAENGQNGWRRCLQGHRMIIVGFEDGRGGQWRVVINEMVGGYGLVQESSDIKDASGGDLEQWSWGNGTHVKFDNTFKKLVTVDVMKSAPTNIPDFVPENAFVKDGGPGMRGTASWSWYPAQEAHDELLFPKGAEVRECRDVNGDWWHGTYMGQRGLFPANYLRVLE